MSYRVTIAEGVEVSIAKLIARPTKPLTDASFKYRRAAETDVAATFARIRREQKQAERKSADTHVVPMRRQGGK